MDNVSNGISITNQCYDCMQLDTMCVDCQDLADARATEIAHNIVDDGNLQYRRQLSWLKDVPSGHDWVSSTTVSRTIIDNEGNEDYIMREEYKLPVVMLQDGGVLDNAWELNDYMQSKREIKCPWCNLFTPKAFADCQDCDKPLEANVR